MINVTTVKTTNRRGTLLATNIATSNPFKSDADSEYDRKKLAQKKAIHAEIRRVALLSSEV